MGKVDDVVSLISGWLLELQRQRKHYGVFCILMFKEPLHSNPDTFSLISSLLETEKVTIVVPDIL